MYFPKVYFAKVYFAKVYFVKVYFLKVYYPREKKLTQSLPSPNFFKPSVPGKVRVFRVFARCNKERFNEEICNKERCNARKFGEEICNEERCIAEKMKQRKVERTEVQHLHCCLHLHLLDANSFPFYHCC